MNLGKLANGLLNPLGLEVRRRRPKGGSGQGMEVVRGPIFDPSTSYMREPGLTGRLAEDLGEIAAAFVRAHLAPTAAPDALRDRCTALAGEFLAVYFDRPVRDNAGGSGFHNAFWLFLLSRYLDPGLIVESGVWKGQTSWLLRQACPKAAVHGFDISLAQLTRPDPTVRFHELDWSGFDFGPVDAATSLCFFDCHVNQARRVREAYEKGFRRLLFDDNPPAHKLYQVVEKPSADRRG